MKRLLIMAAGTGGHVIPGLAVAKEAQSRGWTVTWLGTPNGMENRLVPSTGMTLDRMRFAGLRGKGWWGAIKGTWWLVWGVVQALLVIRKRQVDAVVGMGGYVCLPGGAAAFLAGKPMMLVNADSALLLSNQVLLPMAQHIAFGFDGPDVGALPKAKVTGNPVRAAIAALPEPKERYAGRTGRLRLLVVGGSLGAKVLNETLPAALAELNPEDRPYVVHQTGAAMQQQVQAQYQAHGIDALVLPFIEDMAHALSECDLMVCRSGAMTVSELCAAGVPAVLVPLVVSTTSHQRDNAAWMASRGAAWHLPQTQCTPSALADLIRSMERTQLLAMANNARGLAIAHADRQVVDLIESMVQP